MSRELWTFADMAYLLLAPITILIVSAIIYIAGQITLEEGKIIIISILIALSTFAGLVLLDKHEETNITRD